MSLTKVRDCKTGLINMTCNTVVSNHVNSDHDPSFSCLDV